jgi:hypothetical protein
MSFMVVVVVVVLLLLLLLLFGFANDKKERFLVLLQSLKEVHSERLLVSRIVFSKSAKVPSSRAELL